MLYASFRHLLSSVLGGQLRASKCPTFHTRGRCGVFKKNALNKIIIFLITFFAVNCNQTKQNKMTESKSKFDTEKLTEFAINKITEFAKEHPNETFYGFSIDASLLCLNSEEEFEKTLKYYSRAIGKDTVDSISGGISHAACTIAKDLNLKSIVTMTQSGGTARMVSSFRPAANVYAMTTLKTTFRALSIIWGVVPVLINKYNSADEMPEIAKQKLLEMKAINSDEKFIITGGVPVNVPGTTNYISIL